MLASWRLPAPEAPYSRTACAPISPRASLEISLLADLRPTRDSRLEAVELLNVQHKHHSAAYRNLHRARDKSTRRGGLIRHHIHELLPALTILLHDLSEGGESSFLDA